MAEIRVSRDQQTREKTSRKRPWEESILPDPDPKPGFRHRYIRVSTLAEPDVSNVNVRTREGWEPVAGAEQPSISAHGDKRSGYPDNIVIGGLMLCQMPEEDAEDRRRYFANKSNQQVASIQAEMTSSNDPQVKIVGGIKSELKNHA